MQYKKAAKIKEEMSAIGLSSFAQGEQNLHALTWALSPERLEQANTVIKPLWRA